MLTTWPQRAVAAAAAAEAAMSSEVSIDGAKAAARAIQLSCPAGAGQIERFARRSGEIYGFSNCHTVDRPCWQRKQYYRTV